METASCSKCGFELKHDDRQCPICGTPVPNETSKKIDAQRQSKLKRTYTIIGLFGLIIIVTTAIIIGSTIRAERHRTEELKLAQQKANEEKRRIENALESADRLFEEGSYQEAIQRYRGIQDDAQRIDIDLNDKIDEASEKLSEKNELIRVSKENKKESFYRDLENKLMNSITGSMVFVKGIHSLNHPFNRYIVKYKITNVTDLNNDFYISKYEISNRQFCDFLNIQMHLYKNNLGSGMNRSKAACPIIYWDDKLDIYRIPIELENQPVSCVSVSLIEDFCHWAEARLPSLTEWKYAAAGGEKTHGYDYSGSNFDKEVGSFDLTNVGTKKPNELSIYDMTGNALEYCLGEKIAYDPLEVDVYRYKVFYLCGGGSGGKCNPIYDYGGGFRAVNSGGSKWGFRIVRD